MFKDRYRFLVRASAVYDLIATAAFATPWTFAIVHRLLSSLSPLPDFAPLHVLFANLLGSIVIVWSIIRVRDPQPIYGFYDSIARGLFAVWQLYYLLAMNGSPIVWYFAAAEIAFGIGQGYGYWLLRKIESRQPTNCKVIHRFASAPER